VLCWCWVLVAEYCEQVPACCQVCAFALYRLNTTTNAVMWSSRIIFAQKVIHGNAEKKLNIITMHTVQRWKWSEKWLDYTELSDNHHWTDAAKCKEMDNTQNMSDIYRSTAHVKLLVVRLISWALYPSFIPKPVFTITNYNTMPLAGVFSQTSSRHASTKAGTSLTHCTNSINSPAIHLHSMTLKYRIKVKIAELKVVAFPVSVL